MAKFATLAIADVKSKIEVLPAVGESIYVYTQDQLLEQSLAVQIPFIGIVYEGIFSDNQRVANGLMATLRIAIYVVGDGLGIAGVDTKGGLTDLMDDIRDTMKLQDSASIHKWTFVEETLAPYDDAHFGYVQRWSMKAPLTSA